jgi:methanogenic corrinoid protein MtbC1
MRITRAIETEIIPRLLVSHRRLPMHELRSLAATPGEADVAELARMVVEETPEMAIAFVAARREAGMPLEDVYLRLLSPAARLLGTLWEDDRRSFMEVTIGLGHLQQIVHHFTSDFLSDGGHDGVGRRACIACVPGEQHTFGASLVARFLERDGWEVDMQAGDGPDLGALVRRNWYDLVGISASCDHEFALLCQQVESVRRHSCNPGLIIMVGGRVFNDNPHAFHKSGADLMAADGADAVRRIHALLTYEAVKTQIFATT